jgi:predicted TIM-barrel fold metal-dependent hydrolase
MPLIYFICTTMPIPILDTHQHLWDLNARPHSWTADIPTLNKPFLLEDYAKAKEGTSITRSLHMEADVDIEHLPNENNWIASLVNDADNPLCGAIISGRPENADFSDYLDAWASQDFVKGVRRILHTSPDELSQSDLFVENIRLLASHELTYDLCYLERQLPIASNLVEQCPEVTFVLDHCGVPAVSDGSPEKWREDIRTLSSFQNVNCKVSGIVAYADTEKSIEDQVRPYIDHVIECFGWDRLVFGSDWPVCTLTSSLREWLEILARATSGIAEEDLRKLYYENAERIYGVQQFPS